MDEVAFVEVLDGARVVARHRVERLPAVIGRGYGSDVILDDPGVNPAHARLWRDEAGSLRLEDLDTVNGIVEGAGAPLQGSIVLDPERTLRLGRTLIRVRQPLDPVAPTVRSLPEPPLEPIAPSEPPARRLLERLGSPRIAIGVSAAAAAVFAVDSYLGNTGRVTSAEMLGGALAVLAVLALWAGCWAFASRLLTGRFRFLGHLAIAAVALAAMVLFNGMVGYLRFIAPSAGAQAMLSLLASVAMLAAVIHAHLGLSSSLGRRRRSGFALGFAVTLMLLSSLGDWAASDEFDTSLDYAGDIKPLGSRWVRSVTLDRFMEEAQDLRAEVDEMAREANEK